MSELFISALALGFLFNAAPGAIFTASLRRGIQGGFLPALNIQIGSLVGDFVWALLGLGGVAILFQLKAVEIPLALAGAILLAWLAYGSFKDATRQMPNTDLPADTNSKSDLAYGAALSLSNPMNITYWAGLGGTISALGVREPTGTAFIIFLTGFMTSSILWCFICAGLIAIVQKTITQIGWVIINLMCGIGLAYFAIRVILRTIHGL